MLRKVLVQSDSLTGRIINIWLSAVEAAEKGFFETVSADDKIIKKRFTRSGIANSTCDRVKHYRGFKWDYRYLDEKDIIEYRKKMQDKYQLEKSL